MLSKSAQLQETPPRRRCSTASGDRRTERSADRLPPASRDALCPPARTLMTPLFLVSEGRGTEKCATFLVRLTSFRLIFSLSARNRIARLDRRVGACPLECRASAQASFGGRARRAAFSAGGRSREAAKSCVRRPQKEESVCRGLL